MSVVPFYTQSKPSLPMPSQTNLLMALSEMHDLGKLNPNAPVKPDADVIVPRPKA